MGCMTKDNRIIDILIGLRNTISNFDTKATSLLTAVGIIFGLSTFSTIFINSNSEIINIMFLIFGLMYLALFLVIICLLVFIIFPRRKTAKEIKGNIIFNGYHNDIVSYMDSDLFDSFVKTYDEKAVIDQIKICARIARRKESLLRTATLLIPFFAANLLVLIVLSFINV